MACMEADDGTAHKRRPVLKGLGIALFLLGALGIVVPLLPTTIFWILAVLCLSKAGDARAARILCHPRFGPPIRRFLADGSMSRQSKLAASGGLTLGAVALVPISVAMPVLAYAVWAVLALAGVYILTRPEPDRTRLIPPR